MEKHKFIFLLFFCYSFFGFSQKTTTNFDKAILELNAIGEQLISEIPDEEKFIANEKFKIILKDILANNTSFDYQFDSLKTISILKENELKIYNWALPLSDGEFEYFAFLQIRKGKNENTYSIIELIDKSSEIKTPETKVLTSKIWYGALYYKIIYDKKLSENYYTLLGWDGNNKLTNKKIIEVIDVDNKGTIKLGAPIFKSKGKTKKRVLFEYSENAVMSLKYHPKEKKIVFDFLVPTSSKLEGIYEYYGPSLNRFDAYSLDKNGWNYEEDIDIEQDRNIKDFMWNNPKKK